MSDEYDLVIQDLAIGDQEVVEEIHVLLILDVLDAEIDLLQQLRKEVQLRDPWN